MTPEDYPEYCNITPIERLDPAKQRWVIDALCRLHPVGSGWEMGEARK